MQIVVASQNPVKVRAVESAFSRQFPGEALDVVALDIASGVSGQPSGDEETRHGARTRAINAGDARPEADFCVGLEGGIDIIGDQLMAFAWMAVRDRSGRFSDARSPTLPLPPAIRRLIDDGMELGEANDRVFATVNSKQGGGAFGLLTDGQYTREGIYAQTITLALIPFVNEIYRN